MYIHNLCYITLYITERKRRRSNARNVRPYYPYWQYTDLFIFRLSEHSYLGLYFEKKIENHNRFFITVAL